MTKERERERERDQVVLFIIPKITSLATQLFICLVALLMNPSSFSDLLSGQLI